MGIKLDWEIEAEQQQVQNAGEDREAARRRRLARLRFLAFVLIIVAILGGIAGAIMLRLREVDEQIVQNLRDTVDAEVAALRIGDRAAFLAHQRSANEDWLTRQESLFDEYQTLKVEHDISLTGRALDTVVDGMRGRVTVEEIIDGVPYARVWFYWRYDEGWRHVPPDYTFWGEQATIEGANVLVRYREVDEALALSVRDAVAAWVQTACTALTCDNLPPLTVEILPDEALDVSWSPANPWQLQIPSPYLDRARVDMPFDLNLQLKAANLVAERIVAQVSNNLDPLPTADAAYLRRAVLSWLVERFTGVATNSYLVQSLTQASDAAVVGRLMRVLQPASDVSVVAQAANTSAVTDVSLDWRDFVNWRLALESELIAARDEAAFLNLYDTGDENARAIGYGRFSANLPPEPLDTVSTRVERDANAVPHLYATVRFGPPDAVREEIVIFRLVNGVWRRAN